MKPSEEGQISNLREHAVSPEERNALKEALMEEKARLDAAQQFAM